MRIDLLNKASKITTKSQMPTAISRLLNMSKDFVSVKFPSSPEQNSEWIAALGISEVDLKN